MKIIAFGHRKFVGKDIAAKFLLTEYKITNPNLTVTKKAFADKLKDIAHQIYWWAGLQPKEYYEINPKDKSNVLPLLNKTVRQIWIEIGMKFREIYSDTWIDNILVGTKADILIITDLRFPNEFNKIKEKGGYCVRIDRWSVPPTNDEADFALAQCLGWDYVIENDSTLKNLHNEVMEMSKELLK